MTSPKESILKTPVFDSIMYGISQEELLAREDERNAVYKQVDQATAPKWMFWKRKKMAADTSMIAQAASPTDTTMLASSNTGDGFEVDSLMLADIGLDTVTSDSSILIASSDVLDDEKENEPKYKYRYHPKSAFNMEQVYYNKYYGELFIDNRPPPPTPEQLATMQASADSARLANKWNPFRKKERDGELASIDELIDGELSEVEGETPEGTDAVDTENVETPEQDKEDLPVDQPTDTEQTTNE